MTTCRPPNEIEREKGRLRKQVARNKRSPKERAADNRERRVQYLMRKHNIRHEQADIMITSMDAKKLKK